MDVETILFKARDSFENKFVDIELLRDLYQKYNPLEDCFGFIQKGLEFFPHLNCGLASVYLRHTLKKGRVIKGFYKGIPHTFLWIEGEIMDITADQFGGPRIYKGPLVFPWQISSF